MTEPADDEPSVELADLRRALHRNPELSVHEVPGAARGPFADVVRVDQSLPANCSPHVAPAIEPTTTADAAALDAAARSWPA